MTMLSWNVRKLLPMAKKYKNYHMPPSMAYNLKAKKRFIPPSVITDSTITQVTATSCSSSSASSESSECEETDLYSTEYKQSEVTGQGVASSSSESTDTSESTYFDEEEETEGGTFGKRRQSKTRITNDGMKEMSIGIKSDVLEADIVRHLYDRNVKPLELSGKINNLKKYNDDDDDDMSGRSSVDTEEYHDAVNNALHADSLISISTSYKE